MFNFFQLARLSAGGGQSPLAKGLLPPLATIASLLLVSAAIVFSGWLWGGVLTAVTFGWTSLAVIAVALLNHLFSRDIFTFAFATRNVTEGFDHGDENSIDIEKLVEHLRHELNICYQKKYGAAHEDLPPVRLLSFTENKDFKIFSVGASPENAAILFSTRVLDKATGMNQRNLAAFFLEQLVKIYFRRGTARTITSIGTNLLTTMEMLKYSEAWPRPLEGFSYLFKILVGPIVQFFMLLQFALERNHAYDAAKRVAVDFYRGFDLMEGYDKKVDPNVKHKPTSIESKEIREKHSRESYQGSNFGMTRLTEWIRDNEYSTDYKEKSLVWGWGSLLLSFTMILIRELGFWFKELWSNEPRSTNLCGYVRGLVKGNRPNGEEITLNTVRTGEKWHIKKAEWEKNESLFKEIPEEVRYSPIGPWYKGKRERGNRKQISHGGRVGYEQEYVLYKSVAPHEHKQERQVVTTPFNFLTKTKCK